ncbi:MAG TPA: universal stress protein [Rhodocyclaceae bacterium]|nr:universal stress protein [Rhodocyclaceae bacterium]HMV53000.1 universal stress protein [Rhodocyclaceae bacterium]HNA02365.1 universal stress protein [Rhodocyclaceae bacterium]HNB79270.1 universal stress protein [Rhodocyclaceae bacterium]HNC61403.1 universal stress protein [Rhodocyclaceae bacterium]
MFKHILVPTDGSTLSGDTALRAVDFAKAIGAKVTFFYAQPDYPAQFFGEGALIDPTTPQQFAKAAEATANDILKRCEAFAKEGGVEYGLATGPSEVPYEAIINAAQANGCDMIFMASHGRRGLAGLLLGSETQKVLTHSKIPVLVYR